MKKILLFCATTVLTVSAFANNIGVKTEIDSTVRASRADQVKTDNDERRYYILTGAVTAQDLSNNVLFKNIKMDKRPEPMKPVPLAQ